MVTSSPARRQRCVRSVGRIASGSALPVLFAPAGQRSRRQGRLYGYISDGASAAAMVTRRAEHCLVAVSDGVASLLASDATQSEARRGGNRGSRRANHGVAAESRRIRKRAVGRGISPGVLGSVAETISATVGAAVCGRAGVRRNRADLGMYVGGGASAGASGAETFRAGLSNARVATNDFVGQCHENVCRSVLRKQS